MVSGPSECPASSRSAKPEWRQAHHPASAGLQRSAAQHELDEVLQNISNQFTQDRQRRRDLVKQLNAMHAQALQRTRSRGRASKLEIAFKMQTGRPTPDNSKEPAEVQEM
jgi:hypothetical protein